MERGSWGVELFRICDASLLTGATPGNCWAFVDTNLNGYEANFLPGLARDMYGNWSPVPAIQMYTSISNPPPRWNATPEAAGNSGDISNWNICFGYLDAGSSINRAQPIFQPYRAPGDDRMGRS